MSEASTTAPNPPVSTSFKLGVAVVVVAAVLVLGLALKRAVDKGGAHPLSAEDRAELVVSGQGEATVLSHPELGFKLRHPGPSFFPSKEAESQLRRRFGDDSTRFYAFADVRAGHMLYVTLSRRPGLDAEGFAHMVDNVTTVFTQQTFARVDEGASVETPERTFDHPRGTARVHKSLGGGAAHVRVGAWKSTFGRQESYVVLVVGVSRQADALADVIDSFRVR